MSLTVQEEGKEPGAPVVDAKKAAKEKRMAEQLAKAQKGSQVHIHILSISRAFRLVGLSLAQIDGSHQGLVDMAWLCHLSEVAGST